jgi:glycosyltransferase involved in cell wall biosynthesis
MKILFDPQIFTLQNTGGVSRYFVELMRYFSSTGQVEFKLPIFYSDNIYLKGVDYSRHFSFADKDFPFKKYISKFLKNYNDKILSQHLHSKEYDIYHPTYYNNAIFKEKTSIKYVVTVYDMINELYPEYFRDDKQAESVSITKKRLIENADRIIAISQNTKKDILKYCAVSEDKIDVIYLGNHFDQSSGCNETAIDIPTKYILYVGSRYEYKNFTRFVTAAAPLLIENNDLYLISAGSLPFNNEELSLMAKLGVDHKVIHRFVDDEDLKSLYKNATLFVFPSIYEGFGLPILEAYSCDCPLVLSSTGAFHEIAGSAAEFFDPFCEQSIYTAISKVLFDDDLRHSMIARGQEQAKLFSWKKTGKQTHETYVKTLAGDSK